MTPAEHRQTLALLSRLADGDGTDDDPGGPRTSHAAALALPKSQRRYAETRLLLAVRAKHLAFAGRSKAGSPLYALTPAGLAWLETHDAAAAAESAAE